MYPTFLLLVLVNRSPICLSYLLRSPLSASANYPLLEVGGRGGEPHSQPGGEACFSRRSGLWSCGGMGHAVSYVAALRPTRSVSRVLTGLSESYPLGTHPALSS
ncbi:hypothetical protein GGS26DRAFT_329562 [Hypomontagnella submonticulosa]|nr:hypothetical protein GGS26DRAFT_329562 [Hypomontagnella submonticulosa]